MHTHDYALGGYDFECECVNDPRIRRPFRSMHAEDECRECGARSAPCLCEWQCDGCDGCCLADECEPHEVDGESYCHECALALILEVAS